MKFKKCQKCFYSQFDDTALCMEICMLPIDIIRIVEQYFNDPNTYSEDLESDLYDIVEK